MNRFAVFAFVTGLLLGASAQAQPSVLPPADSKALHGYVLSLDKIGAMQGAYDDEEALKKKDPVFAKQDDALGNASQNVLDMEARFNANAKLVALYRKHGLSTQDAILMPLVLLSANTVMDDPSTAASMSDQVTPAQIAFFRQHAKELKAMPWLFGTDH